MLLELSDPCFDDLFIEEELEEIMHVGDQHSKTKELPTHLQKLLEELKVN